MNVQLLLRYLFALLAGAILGWAQTDAAFEVASIKPNRTGARNSGFHRAAPGALNATNVSLKLLVTFAYDVRDYQISGGPDWFESDRFDILAKPESGSDSQPLSAVEQNALLRRRVQALLADRFQLTLHHTTKELPMFALVVGKNGTKLKPSEGKGMELVTNGHHLLCRQVGMPTFAKIFLENELRRSVVDKTGIAGEFDFTLDWVQDEAQRRQPEPGEASTPGVDGPSLFTALQEQLGLKLEPTKGPVEVLVIDHAERASEN